MSRHLLPLSIFALAAAVAFHAIVPAHASDAPRIAAECKMTNAKQMEEWLSSGRDKFVTVTGGTVCAWR